MFEMIIKFEKLILLIILNYHDQLYCQSSLDTNSTNSLFPAPKLDFIDQNSTKNCYDLCLSKNTISCYQCIHSNRTPDSVDNKTFCCFYYQQIYCTFDCISNELDNQYSQTKVGANQTEGVNQTVDGFRVENNLTQIQDQILVKIQDMNECIPYDYRKPQDCEFEDKKKPNLETNITQNEALTTDMTEFFIPEIPDISTVALILVIMGSVFLALVLFGVVIYLTHIEKKHLTAVKGKTERIDN